MEDEAQSPLMEVAHQSLLPATTKATTRSGLTHSLTIKLDENNFLLWSQQVNGVITAHNLHRFVVNPKIPLQFASIEDRATATNSAEYQQWLVKDQTLFTWLLSTISDGVLPRVLSCRHAYEVWDKIHKYFNSVLKSRARQLRSELKNTKKNSRSVNEYLLRIKSIVNSLVAVGDIVTEQEQVDSILEGLPEEFNSFVMMVYSRFDTPTVEDVEALLLLQEVQFEKFKQELTNPSVSANIAHTAAHTSDSTSETESQEIGTEHYNAMPHRGRGRGRGRGGRGRGKGPASGQGKVTCQICSKPNHDAINCWYRYDPQAMRPNTRGHNTGPSPRPQHFSPYMRPSAHLAMPHPYAAMSDTASSSSGAWYPDSGASHHLTYNPNNLSYQVPYGGHDQVLMGNGQGVSIHSLGQSEFNSPNEPMVKLTLKDLLHVPNISKNLLSGSNQVLLEGIVGADGLYQFKPFQFLSNNEANSSSNQVHSVAKPVMSINTASVSMPMAVQFSIPITFLFVIKLSNIPFYLKDSLIPCISCCIAPFVSYNGYNYYITFVDTFTKYTWIYFLKAKSDAIKAFSQFLALVHNQFHASIKALQSDWGGEFRPFTTLLSELVTSQSQTPDSYPTNIMFPTLDNDTVSQSILQSSSQPATSIHSPSPTGCQTVPLTPHLSTPLTVAQINSQISQPLPSLLPHLSTNEPSTSLSQPDPPVISHHNDHPMITRGKTGSLKPKVFLAELEPKSVRSALSDPKWKQAMQDEYKALMDNKTWSLVPLPPHRKAIGCKWIFRVKENPDGTINKFKARLVAKGFLQTAGFDFTETFSPVIKPITIRIILTLAVTFKWQVQQIDVNNAFLNGVLQEEVYMAQPSGFESSDKSLVCKLHKSLYGLKQAPRAWYDRLTQALLQLGFIKSKCDPSLLVHNQNGTCTYVLIYVDDILIIGSAPHLINDLINKLNMSFALKRLGQVDYFLGIEVHHLSSGALLLNQSKYVRDLLCKAKMEDSKPIGSPMVSSCRLSKYGTDTMTDPTLYRSVVGALQYATLTRPDIAFSVNKVCQFMAHPLESHWKAVKRILRYLKGTLSHGLLLNPSSAGPPFSLRAYSDADWATDHDDRRSTSGSCIYFGPNLVSWGSKKQPLVARSSTEAEYRSMANTTADLLWIQSLLRELQVPFLTPTLLCDNLSAVSLAHNPVLHSKTKHLELDIHFVREKVISKKLNVLHIPAGYQLADPLTKPLSPASFASLRSKLKVFPLG
ncbi:retrovirus-related Pol polyprotein from transposon TNT 1-94 [Trifolium pratense]|uniref:Retrovirus-related Pol polyprotein from transposon TNT 1-94 n=1 Tax=Trifolium pratense TaxID=57577 RepID=A0A2K3PS37_TRIPR|nr:retrovirus-related Pol polyprotein from transposon TNT 1-94 [Trifolium pratense]